MVHVAYEVVDVFTTVRFGGNPLAVIPDARGLDDTLMQQIAAEFGFSETSFVLPPADPQNTARVRIFTPTTEVPFAGHPNVGTAFMLAQRDAIFGQTVGEQMRFEELAGLVDVTVLRSDGTVTGAAIIAPRALELGQEVAVDLVVACASLTREDIALTRHPPRIVSVGLPFVVAELASRTALARARADLNRFTEANAIVPLPDDGFSLFLYTPTSGDPQRFSARMFSPLDNVLEDPATGSASAALAAYYVTLMPQQDADIALIVEQGVDMGRPSQIRLRVRKVGGVVQQVIVSGDCVPVMHGELSL
ncbi:MAG: PhzF family phenazine biosynthesis protein [Chloroflexales bacterium]|nr:PhzF family phenazine biosynthesis protein [Chloroflexales bacterium]